MVGNFLLPTSTVWYVCTCSQSCRYVWRNWTQATGRGGLYGDVKQGETGMSTSPSPILPHHIWLDVQPGSSIRILGGLDIHSGGDGLVVDGLVVWFGSFNKVLSTVSWKLLWFMIPSPTPYVPRQLYTNTTRGTGRIAMLEAKFLSMSDIELVLVQMWSWSCSKDAAPSFLLFAVKESRTPECLCLSICVTSRNLTLPTFRKTFFWLAILTASRTLASRLAVSTQNEWASPSDHRFPIICGSEDVHSCICVIVGTDLEHVETNFVWCWVTSLEDMLWVMLS